MMKGLLRQRGGAVADVCYTTLVLVAATAMFHRVQGEPKIRAAEARIEAVRNLHAADVARAEKETRAIEREIARLVGRRDSLTTRAEEVRLDFRDKASAIRWAENRAAEVAERSLELVDRLDTREKQVARAGTKASVLADRVGELDRAIATARDTLRAVESRRVPLTLRVGALAARSGRRSPGLFAGPTGLSAFLQAGEATNYLAFSLTRDVTQVGDWRLGLAGTFGFGDEPRLSLRDLGLYGNRDLIPGFVSMDLGFGFERLRRGTGDASSDPYGTLFFRVAPTSHERAFLLLGVKAAREETQPLFGVGIGRR